MLNVMDCQTENGLRIICADWPEGYTPSRVSISAASRTLEATPEERLDHLGKSNISLSERLSQLERVTPSTTSQEPESEVQEAFTLVDERAENIMVDRIICLGSSNPAIKRKALDAIETEKMTKEEARESLREDALVDRILKRGGK